MNTELPLYQSHKQVRAGKITMIAENDKHQPLLCIGGLAGGIIVDKEYLAKHSPEVGGYYVQYEDGYESYCPAASFEAGNALIEEIVLPVESLSFGQALVDLRAGKRLARSGWNGKGMFIEQQNTDEHSKMSSSYLYIDTSGLETSNPDAPKCRVPWLPSQTDMLSFDWMVVG